MNGWPNAVNATPMAKGTTPLLPPKPPAMLIAHSHMPQVHKDAPITKLHNSNARYRTD